MRGAAPGSRLCARLRCFHTRSTRGLLGASLEAEAFVEPFAGARSERGALLEGLNGTRSDHGWEGGQGVGGGARGAAARLSPWSLGTCLPPGLRRVGRIAARSATVRRRPSVSAVTFQPSPPVGGSADRWPRQPSGPNTYRRAEDRAFRALAALMSPRPGVLYAASGRYPLRHSSTWVLAPEVLRASRIARTSGSPSASDSAPGQPDPVGLSWSDVTEAVELRSGSCGSGSVVSARCATADRSCGVDGFLAGWCPWRARAGQA